MCRQVAVLVFLKHGPRVSQIYDVCPFQVIMEWMKGMGIIEAIASHLHGGKIGASNVKDMASNLKALTDDEMVGKNTHTRLRSVLHANRSGVSSLKFHLDICRYEEGGWIWVEPCLGIRPSATL